MVWSNQVKKFSWVYKTSNYGKSHVFQFGSDFFYIIIFYQFEMVENDMMITIEIRFQKAGSFFQWFFFFDRFSCLCDSPKKELLYVFQFVFHIQSSHQDINIDERKYPIEWVIKWIRWYKLKLVVTPYECN